MQYELIIFDWDGTLMDSVPRIVSCMQAAALEAEWGALTARYFTCPGRAASRTLCALLCAGRRHADGVFWRCRSSYRPFARA